METVFHRFAIFNPSLVCFRNQINDLDYCLKHQVTSQKVDRSPRANGLVCLFPFGMQPSFKEYVLVTEI